MTAPNDPAGYPVPNPEMTPPMAAGAYLWHAAINDQRVGPLDQAAVMAYIAEGSITPQTLVWREGMLDWTPAGQTELAYLGFASSGEPNVHPAPLPVQPLEYAGLDLPRPMRFDGLWRAWSTCLMAFFFFLASCGIIELQGSSSAYSDYESSLLRPTRMVGILIGLGMAAAFAYFVVFKTFRQISSALIRLICIGVPAILLVLSVTLMLVEFNAQLGAWDTLPFMASMVSVAGTLASVLCVFLLPPLLRAHCPDHATWGYCLGAGAILWALSCATPSMNRTYGIRHFDSHFKSQYPSEYYDKYSYQSSNYTPVRKNGKTRWNYYQDRSSHAYTAARSTEPAGYLTAGTAVLYLLMMVFQFKRIGNNAERAMAIGGCVLLIGIGLCTAAGAHDRDFRYSDIGVPFLLALVANVAAIVLFCFMLCGLWAMLPKQPDQPSPATAVGFIFIPLFNLYWFGFVAIYQLTRRSNQLLYGSGLQRKPASEGLALAVAILVACVVIPFVGWAGLVVAAVMNMVVFHQLTQNALALMRARGAEV